MGPLKSVNAEPLLEKFLTFEEKGKQFTAHIANDLQTREQAYKLVYEVYSRRGLGQPHPSRMWYSLANLLVDTITVIVKSEGVTVAAMTVVHDSPQLLPADEIYSEELSRQRALGHGLGEVLHLGIRHDVRGTKAIMGKLMNVNYLVSRYIRKITHWFFTVMPHHEKWYRHQMLCERIGTEGFHEKTGVTCVLIAHPLNLYDGVQEEVRERTFFRYYIPSNEEAIVAKQLKGLINPISSEEFNYFLSKHPEIWEKATPHQRAYIQAHRKDYQYAQAQTEVSLYST